MKTRIGIERPIELQDTTLDTLDTCRAERIHKYPGICCGIHVEEAEEVYRCGMGGVTWGQEEVR